MHDWKQYELNSDHRRLAPEDVPYTVEFLIDLSGISDH